MQTKSQSQYHFLAWGDQAKIVRRLNLCGSAEAGGSCGCWQKWPTVLNEWGTGSVWLVNSCAGKGRVRVFKDREASQVRGQGRPTQSFSLSRSPIWKGKCRQNRAVEGRKVCQKRCRTQGEHGPLNQLSRDQMGSPRLKWQAESLHGSVPGPCVLCLLVRYFCESPNSANGWVSDSCLLLVHFLFDCFVQPLCEDFCLVLLYLILLYLVVFSWRPAVFWRET